MSLNIRQPHLLRTLQETQRRSSPRKNKSSKRYKPGWTSSRRERDALRSKRECECLGWLRNEKSACAAKGIEYFWRSISCIGGRSSAKDVTSIIVISLEFDWQFYLSTGDH